MNKPISVTIDEIKNNLVNTINTSGLHPTLLQLIVKDVYNEVNALATEYSNKERQEYESALANENEKPNN